MRKFLATTALAMTMATAATAQTASPYMDQAEIGDVMASEYIGMYIYTADYAEADAEALRVQDNKLLANDAEIDWNNIGEVHDIVLTRDGDVRGVLLDIGGFLGIGEKQVLVDMGEIQMVREGDDESGEFFLVVNASKDELMDAPAFDRSTLLADEMAAVEAGAETMATKAEAEVAEAGTAIENASEEATAEVAEATDSMAEEMKTETNEALAALEVEGFNTVVPDEITTEELTGVVVYTIGNENAGEINSLIVNSDGTIEKAIIDFGGFLGIGEKQVAVDFDQLSIQRQDGGDELRVYIDTTKEQLETMPEYQEG